MLGNSPSEEDLQAELFFPGCENMAEGIPLWKLQLSLDRIWANIFFFFLIEWPKAETLSQVLEERHRKFQKIESNDHVFKLFFRNLNPEL